MPNPKNNPKIRVLAKDNLEVLWQRAAKVAVPVAAIGGFTADVLTPLGPFVLGFLVLTSFLCLVTGIVWFGYKRRQITKAKADGVIDDAEFAKIVRVNTWSVAFAFNLCASVVLLLFFGAQKVMASPEENPNLGAFAKLVPAIKQMQAQLLNIQETTQRIEASTSRIEDTTMKIDQKADQMNEAIAKLDEKVAQIVDHSNDGTRAQAEPVVACESPKAVSPYGKVFDGEGITVEMATVVAKNQVGQNDVLLKISGAPAFEAGIDGQVIRYFTKAGYQGGTDFTYKENGQEPVRMIFRTTHEGDSVRVFLKNDQAYDVKVNPKRSKALCPAALEKAVSQKL